MIGLQAARRCGVGGACPKPGPKPGGIHVFTPWTFTRGIAHPLPAGLPHQPPTPYSVKILIQTQDANPKILAGQTLNLFCPSLPGIGLRRSWVEGHIMAVAARPETDPTHCLATTAAPPRPRATLLVHPVVPAPAAGAGRGGPVARERALPASPRALHRTELHVQGRAAPAVESIVSVTAAWRGALARRCHDYQGLRRLSGSLSIWRVADHAHAQRLLARSYVGAGPWTTLALNAGCGGAAGAIALGMIYPFEFVNIRMAAATSNHQFGVSECLASVLSWSVTFN
jgi:hypothetical protein